MIAGLVVLFVIVAFVWYVTGATQDFPKEPR
jgi:hypothetical protein